MMAMDDDHSCDLVGFYPRRLHALDQPAHPRVHKYLMFTRIELQKGAR